MSYVLESHYWELRLNSLCFGNIQNEMQPSAAIRQKNIQPAICEWMIAYINAHMPPVTWI